MNHWRLALVVVSTAL